MQVDILGQSIYELSHPCDHAEIKEMLSTKDLSTQKSHFLRMKCTLTSKGRNVNIKSASYKVINYFKLNFTIYSLKDYFIIYNFKNTS